MFKRVFWLSAMLAVSAFAGQIIIKSGVLSRQDVAVAGESTWDRLANATSQTTQELWNSTKSLMKSASVFLPDAVIQSLSGELPPHDATVGVMPGQASVSGGSASYNIPIALPPGRKGMQPNISLSYSSRGGNGVAGMGWNISGLSSMHRCPMTVEQDGQARGVDYSMNDRLCFDGQRLVATSGTYGGLNTKYATEIDSFARITQLGGDLNSASSYFKVEYKSGEIAYFGATPTTSNHKARVIAGGATKPLNWLIARSEDRLGNNITYYYTDFGQPTFGEVQPTAIYYTGYNGTGTDGDRKVEFLYETRPTTNGANDQSSSYLAGGVTRQTQRLTTIKTWVAAEAVREYRLNYGAISASSGRSLLRSVQECAMLGAVATCRMPTSFAWQEGAPTQDFKPQSSLASWGGGILRNVGDLDGDGSKDLFWEKAWDNPQATSKLLSMNSSGSIKWSFDVPSSMTYSRENRYADFDMDGKSEIITIVNNTIVVNFWRDPSQTSSFASAFSTSWNTGIPVSGTYEYFLNDMDGDGRTDIVINGNTSGCSNLRARVFRNVPSATPGAMGSFTEIANPCLPSGKHVKKISDFNGDGLPDLWLHTADSNYTNTQGMSTLEHIYLGQRNPNYGFVAATFASYFPSNDLIKTEESMLGQSLHWLDINGDGLEDMLYTRRVLVDSMPKGYWTIRLNNAGKLGARILTNETTGTGRAKKWEDQTPQQSTLWVSDRDGLFSQGDIDSDGREELKVPYKFAVRICAYYYAPPDEGGQPQIVSNPEDPDAPGVEPGGSGSRLAPGGASAMGVNPESQVVCPFLAGSNQPYSYLINTPAPGASYDTNGDGQINVLDGTEMIGDGTGGALSEQLTGLVNGQSLYYMSALQFIEIAPNQFTLRAIPTTHIGGEDNLDLYGDGFEDSTVRFACDYTGIDQCMLLGDPGRWPNNDIIRNGGSYYFNQYGGPAGQKHAEDLTTPLAPDMLASVTDGIGNQTAWSYFPLSNKAGRGVNDTPLYSIPTLSSQRYVDDRHVYFASSMHVVSEMKQSNGIGGENTMRYSYSEAMYNTQGRGFQGFRKIIEEDMTGGLRTTTTFSQKYPLTSRVEKIVVNPLSRAGETSPISQTDNIWRCNRLNRNDTAACNVTPGTNPVRFVYQSLSEHVTFDLNTAIAGLPNKLTGFTADYYADTTACDGGTISTVSGYDVYGNITAKTHFVSDYSDGTPGYKNYIALSCNRTRNTFAAADTTNWWLDKLTNTETRNEILHGADQPLPVGASNPVYITNTGYTWNINVLGRTLATETFQSGITNQQKVTTYTYPASSNYGLPLSVTVTASGDQNAGGRTTSTSYSTDGYFPLSITNALGHTATTVVRLRDGLPISVTDLNGLRTLTTYDAFSQATLVKSRGALDSQYLAPDKQVAATWCIVTSGVNSCGLSNAAYQLTSVQDGSPTSVSTHDALGRILRTQSKLLDGTNSYSDTQYNNKGQTTAQSMPYRSGDTPLWTYFVSYDFLSRLTAKTSPQQHATRGDMVTTYTYTGRTTAIQVCGTLDPNTANCLNLSRTTDATGRYVETTDAIGGVTKFWFDANGQAAVLQDVKGSQIKATYNAIGQRISINDPNQGISNFTYNALGEVLTQTDARSITSTTTYDKLGRKTQFTVTADANGDGTNDAVVDTWTYDPTSAKGQLSQSKRTINGVIERQENNTFDALIRPSAVSAIQNTGGGTTRTYNSEFQYDTYYGRVLAQFMPNGEGEQFIFNQYGYETEQRNAINASVYRQITTVDSAGRPTRELKGFNLSTDTVYWPNGQTKSIVHQKDGVTIRKIDYAYDVFGNVETQELNNGLASNTLETFGYDKLHRLTQSVRSGAASKTVSYGYDAAGNFTSKSDFSLATGTPYNLSTGGLGGGGANAVKSVELKAGGTRSYSYDASGNMTADNAGFAAIYDHANLATKLQRGAVINYFSYGPNKFKAKQTGSDGSKVYVGHYEDWITANQTKVILGNYAQITNGTGGRMLHYFLTDRLGSVDAVTDGNGNLIETRGYDAFGAPRTGAWDDATQIASTAITPKGFTSHEHLNSVQLIHMNGRMYDYQLGRFLGVDPFIQAPTNSQSMNPYSYIMNNPLSGTDPTGYAAECGGDPTCVGMGADVAAFGNGRSITGLPSCSFCFDDNGSDQEKGSNSSVETKEGQITHNMRYALEDHSFAERWDHAAKQLLPGIVDAGLNAEPGNGWDYARNVGAALLNLVPNTISGSVNGSIAGQVYNEITGDALVKLPTISYTNPGKGGVAIVEGALVLTAATGVRFLRSAPVIEATETTTIRSATSGDNLVYRSASGTPSSMTPRPVDKTGLSASNSLENAKPGKNQIIDVTRFKSLCAVCDNARTGHVTIKPKDMSQMQDWIDSRGGNSVHPLTKELMDAVVGTDKK